jgi:hypothetical protein
MKKFWIVAILLVSVANAAAMAVQKNNGNNPSESNDSGQEVKAGDSNDSNSSSELLDIVEVEGPNTVIPGYISGDAFNLSFASLLKEYVNQQGLVNYSKLRRFRIQLNEASDKISNLAPEVYITWSQPEKIAFWINVYNICTLKAIVDNYPIKPSRFMLLFYPPNSIMHIPGMRDKIYFMIMGIQYTLEEIERDVLVGRFEDPRILFAISYGTMSSPSLRAEPYLGKVLDKQLDRQIKNYFARPDAFRIDEAGKIVYLSPIFKIYPWHQNLFLKRYGTNQLFRQHQPIDGAALNFVKDYISRANADFLKKKEYSVEYIKYNWQLNEQIPE